MFVCMRSGDNVAHGRASCLKQFVAPSSIYLFLSVSLSSLFFIIAYYFILICVECVTAIISIEVSPTVGHAHVQNILELHTFSLQSDRPCWVASPKHYCYLIIIKQQQNNNTKNDSG